MKIHKHFTMNNISITLAEILLLNYYSGVFFLCQDSIGLTPRICQVHLWIVTLNILNTIWYCSME